MEFISQNEKETIEFAKKIAHKCKGGQVLALFGDLGSGKTTFAKGFALGLKIEKNITSPTFTIMKQYELPKNSKAKFLVHIDCYRLATRDDLEAIGFFEFVGDKDYIVLLEWPECVWSEIKDFSQKITFTHIDDCRRRIQYDS